MFGKMILDFFYLEYCVCFMVINYYLLVDVLKMGAWVVNLFLGTIFLLLTFRSEK